MKFLMTCTTQELALMMTLCGYPEAAKGMAESALGKKSTKEWDAVMEASSHQLMLKQIWDEERFRRDEVPLADELQDFIKHYVESKWMIRCSDAPNEGVLMIHHYDETSWLGHIISKDIIHEFFYIANDEIPATIKDYYSFAAIPSIVEEKFLLADEAFDLLSDKNQTIKVRQMRDFSADEERSFDRFLADLQEQNWSLYNISYFNIPNMDDPYLENILFFLPSPKGVWLVEYTDHPTLPVQVHLASLDEWHDLLEGVGTVAAYAN
jgi:hypothetical protein